MLLLAIGSISVIIICCIIKKLQDEIFMFESEMLLSSEANADDDTLSSYAAIKKALENKNELEH